MINIRRALTADVNNAVELGIKAYERERKTVPAMIPMQNEFRDNLSGLIKYLFDQPYAMVAEEDGLMTGYLGFCQPGEGFFGNVRGAFSPTGGNAFEGSNRAKLSSILYEKTAELLVKDNVCSHNICRFAHDDEVGKQFVLNGFGIRCSDAVMKLSERKRMELNPNYTFRELTGVDKRLITPLRKGLSAHLTAAPTFFPDDLSVFDEFYHKPKRVLVMEEAGTIIGFLAMQEEGETYMTLHPSMMNICGAYVDSQKRGTDAAAQILEYLCRVCEQEGREYLGVDCETLNPTALRFWAKHFDAYTYSYSRRIDERCVGYEQYWDDYWKNDQKND